MKLILIIASLGLALSIRSVRADTIVYRVKQNDTLQLIAAEHYGDRTKAIFIMVENKITHPKPLRPGERLRIPVSREIITNADDSWETLARAHLGDSRRGEFFAEFNKMNPKEGVPAGTTLHVPFTVTHAAAAQESLASISAAYFGESKHADMLRRYNFLEKTSLERGESITIPVFHVRLQASKVPAADPDAKRRQALRQTAASKAAAAVPKAWEHWRVGNYAEIEALLLKIEVEFADPQHAADVHLLLGMVHTAEGKQELATDDFRNVRKIKPDMVLHSFDHSPKILELWKKAGGKVE
jgi:LysM repeat protein